jgi:hypothetical protein
LTDPEIDQALRARCDSLDAFIVREMRKVALAAGDFLSRPDVRQALDMLRERFENWRDRQLDELQAQLLRGRGRLN